MTFLFTPPIRAATFEASLRGRGAISIHAARVGSDGTASARVLVRISFHAARVGSDGSCQRACKYFYSRHPCGQRRIRLLMPHRWSIFLFTPPVWAATGGYMAAKVRTRHFYSRHPCGQRPCFRPHQSPLSFISIHATRVGSDLGHADGRLTRSRFLFTPPVWAATTSWWTAGLTFKSFLFTPPVWAATQGARRRSRTPRHFYSRHPCGQRQQYCTISFHYFVIMLCNQPDL